jgi:uncharacterized protein with GYD domain
MPTYVTLIKYTDQWIKNIKDIEKAQERGIRNAEKMGAKLIGMYFLMGEYDLVAISESANDETAVAGSLAASLDGNIRTTTLRAFTKEEFGEILKKLP